jgi:hypothetical protein
MVSSTLLRRPKNQRVGNDSRRQSGQAPIETTVSRFNGAVASVVVHIHALTIAHAAAVVSPFSIL